MEYIIISLLIVTIILLIILISRKNNNEINEKLNKTEINLIKEIGDFKLNFSNDLNKDFNNLNSKKQIKHLLEY